MVTSSRLMIQAKSDWTHTFSSCYIAIRGTNSNSNCNCNSNSNCTSTNSNCTNTNSNSNSNSNCTNSNSNSNCTSTNSNSNCTNSNSNSTKHCTSTNSNCTNTNSNSNAIAPNTLTSKIDEIPQVSSHDESKEDDHGDSQPEIRILHTVSADEVMIAKKRRAEESGAIIDLTKSVENERPEKRQRIEELTSPKRKRENNEEGGPAIKKQASMQA
eukprot:CAMPEP_0197361226 /NCGR_PEP_ID=MMETSP0893-20130614/63241_1 /TAXON_ID=44058 ORGANISM="Aureoumbra lagunensis, Strain CCMP1510" /NCGR_SAMPLE_ID=MMETSP0893 /ASSEMBLY_ACC=CAM_ASM_000539 /LENGTH=213 /DNA_ID=CAMNT_0042882687 /DNA_START=567 /DNA_END=1210 /DNA_ORIENTATION=+